MSIRPGTITKYDLNQDRRHNDVNEITGITEGGGEEAWADPVWSDRGNMTTAPQPTDLASTYTCKYDAAQSGDIILFSLTERPDGGTL